MEEAIVPQIYDPSLIDVQEMIESEEAFEMARQLISREGIFAGMSSGAAMLAAVRTAPHRPWQYCGDSSRPSREISQHCFVCSL